MEQTLPRHLTHHEALTEAQTAHLSDVTGKYRCEHYTRIVRALLAQKVDGYHDSEAGDWQAAARQLLATATAPDCLLSADTVRKATVALAEALAAYRPAKALNVLVRLETVRLEAAAARTSDLVKPADELFPTTNAAA